MFSSIDQIVEEFSINSGDLKKSLKKQLSELNKLKPKDGFSEQQQIKYDRLVNAVSFVNETRKNSQLTIQDKTITDLIEIIKDSLPDREQSLKNTIDSRINVGIQNYRSPFFIPKITVTAISTLLGLLIALPDSIQDGSYADHLLQPRQTFEWIWISLIIFTGMIWVFAYQSGERNKDRVSRLNVDSVQNEIFEDFVKYIETDSFLKDDLTNYIFQTSHLGVSARIFREGSVTLELAQGISDLIIARAQRKGIIKLSLSKSLTDKYLLTDKSLTSENKTES